MEASKMHVMLDIKDIFKLQGKGHSDIAELMHKDKTVVDKQLSAQNGTQTLLTAYGYAEAAGGRIVFMLDKDWERWKKMEKELPELREQLKDKEKQLDAMKHEAEAASMQADTMNKIIQRLEKQVEDKEDSIRRKEAAISRKDGIIADLLRKAGVLYEK